MNLPNAERAEIPEAKLRDYLLSPSHAVGRFKARFFRSLGYTQDDWRVLSADLLELARSGEADEVESIHGRKFRIVGSLASASDSSIQLVTVWIIAPNADAPRFVTAYPLD